MQNVYPQVDEGDHVPGVGEEEPDHSPEGGRGGSHHTE